MIPPQFQHHGAPQHKAPPMHGGPIPHGAPQAHPMAPNPAQGQPMPGQNPLAALMQRLGMGAHP